MRLMYKINELQAGVFMKQTSLCYIENGGRYLMMHRTKKSNDESSGKWIGIGGKFEAVSYTHLRAHET